MAEGSLAGVQRVGLDAFDSDPTRVGGLCILRDPELHDSLVALKESPAAWNQAPTTPAFNEEVLGLRVRLQQKYGWDVAPHFVLISDTGNKVWPIHTDWEGATFLDPGLFTLWAPLSHFGEPQLMVFRPTCWPPPDCGFLLDETGLYGKTLYREGLYRRFAGASDLALAEVALDEGEVLAFNAAVPHCTHPAASTGRLAINVRCPGNLGTATEPRVRVNTSSPHAFSLLRNSIASPLTHVGRDVDARSTPKGYFESSPSLRHEERKARVRRFFRRIPGWGRMRSWLLRA